MTASSQIAERLTSKIAEKYCSSGAKEDIRRMILAEISPMEAVIQPSLFDNDRGDQRAKVLKALKRARSSGCTNVELGEICQRFGARVYEMRREGYKIGRTQISKGVFRYILSPESW